MKKYTKVELRKRREAVVIIPTRKGYFSGAYTAQSDIMGSHAGTCPNDTAKLFIYVSFWIYIVIWIIHVADQNSGGAQKTSRDGDGIGSNLS